MAFTIKYDKDKDCILIKIQGELNLSLLQQLASKVSVMIKQVGCNRVLNDLRKAKLEENAIDIYSMPEKARNSGVHMMCKRALVAGRRIHEFKFLETVFLNQGHQVKMFEEVDDAWDWLLG